MTGAQPRRRSGRRFPRAEPPTNKPAADPMSSVAARFVARGLRELDRVWGHQPRTDGLPMLVGSRSYGERRDRCYSVLLGRHLVGAVGQEDD
jgi:hypothetical protein